jgi:hypothetical protein
MIIDLDSWEAGYYDALVGRPSQCTASLDQISYSSGYSQARAYGAELQGEAPHPRYHERRRADGLRLIII